LSIRATQHGAAGVLILAVLAIVLVCLGATSVLSRIAASNDDSGKAVVLLAKAQANLEAYAASAQRLPCPANPALDNGVEVPNPLDPAGCSIPDGTLPWLTIGLRREDAYDPWGRKLSYRVYTGNKGSLTQPGGVSMVNCDLIEPSPGGTTSVSGALGGLCEPGATIQDRNTTTDQFLNGKGLDLTDMDQPIFHDVAYVIVSHGASGYGGYTISGARLDMPSGDEKKNCDPNGPFTIKAHSDPDTNYSSSQHFDDYLAYRRIDDLVRRIGLYARDWPET
jgi:hypothetical protein